MITLAGGQSVKVTLSLGITHLNEHEVSLDGLLHKADQALYLAKDAGRNMVMVTD